MSYTISCGLLMFNREGDRINYFLVHPGGPFFQNRDEGYWSVPKGLQEKDENKLETAKREFEEETGIKPEGEFIPLGSAVQKNNKEVFAWAFESSLSGKIDITCNTFMLEYPPKSGKHIEIPEVDRGEFFDEKTARIKINEAQEVFINRLAKKTGTEK